MMCNYLGLLVLDGGINGAILLSMVLAALGLAFYFFPSWVGRNKQNATAIFVFNLFLGWTFSGWVGALVWALTVDSKAEPAPGMTRFSRQSPR